ncbi:lysozyme-like [Tropilaelaps mercedesae]|uniref:lysozyme n=1 Tax=Tropilaelaps mercedesae TaxID=418985 RepID=A0A1V9WY83_9ACAR|nr:lysozyme-like [Tropilaelaps mercedesae]
MRGSMVLFLIVTICVVVLYPLASAQEDLVARTERCLQCICLGSSKCDETTRCTDYGGDKATGEVCGPFQITQPYWEDAGKPGNDFLSCVNTRDCSETAIINYMEKFGKDCDGDGEVTCGDYARIHTAGIAACDAPWVEFTPFWVAFNECDSTPAAGQGRSGNEPRIETRAMLRTP